MEIFCYFAHLQQRKLNKELINESWKAFINFSAAKTVLLSWVSYHKYSNLLCFSAPPFYLVSLILTGITLPSPQAVLAQPNRHSSEGYKTSCGFKPKLIPISYMFTVEPAFFWLQYLYSLCCIYSPECIYTECSCVSSMLLWCHP